MSVIAEIDLDTDRLACAGAIEAVPEVELDLEREFTTGSETAVVFMWARATAEELDRFEDGLAADGTVSDAKRLGDHGGERLYRMTLTGAAPVVTAPVWVELGAARLAMRYFDGHWRARMRFPDRETLSAFRDFCETENLGFRLHRLCDAEGREEAVGDGLTDCQREALRLAVDRGYFDLPRRTSLADLAADLEISDQAVSERLRRGCARLIRQHVD
ncbi:helix-turn-helix domain-containing protein [Halobacteriales archaeon QS_3_64_16]|nr:MAG: helix-turn-helix domain-containing protein [Halobacteriales archaeon QS_3_64_16]